jgi:phosphate starvation-inducible protein PhoH
MEKTLNTEKRIPKTEPKIDFELTQEQKDVVSSYYENDILFINGDFGSGKTAISCYIALKAFFKRQINEIVITKPVLKSRINVLGSVPGTLEEKLEVHIAHIKQCFYELQSKEKIESMIQKGYIKFIDINLIKGYTFGSTEPTLIIVDEYQDQNYEDFRTILSRVGKHAKIMFTGSKQQIDKSIGTRSCIYRFDKLNNTPKGIAIHTLTSQHRNEKAFELINLLDKE